MATTVGTLSEFMGFIKKGKFTRRYHYEVTMPKLSGVTYGGNAKDLVMRCESFVLPGQNIETSVDNIRIGPTREHAFSVNYAPVTGVFLCDDKFSEKKFFEDWQELAFDKETFKVKYYNDFVADISIKQFALGDGPPPALDPILKSIYECTLIDAFPKNVVQMDLNTADGELHRLSVEFQYHHWTT